MMLTIERGMNEFSGELPDISVDAGVFWDTISFKLDFFGRFMCQT
jgi:hypothetical protein